MTSTPDLFGYVADSHAYPTGPGHKGGDGTSQQAAQALAPEVSGIRRIVLRAFCARHPAGMTSDEAAAAVKLSILTVRPRCTELRRMNMLEATAERRRNGSGNTATVLRASRNAMEMAR